MPIQPVEMASLMEVGHENVNPQSMRRKVFISGASDQTFSGNGFLGKNPLAFDGPGWLNDSGSTVTIDKVEVQRDDGSGWSPFWRGNSSKDVPNCNQYTVTAIETSWTDGLGEMFIRGASTSQTYDYQLVNDNFNDISDPGASISESASPFDVFELNADLVVDRTASKLEFTNASGSEWTADRLRAEINSDKIAQGALNKTFTVPDGATLEIDTVKITVNL